MKEIRISVRALVEFVLRTGDIRTGGLWRSTEAMLEGARVHRRLQASMGSTYTAEVPLCFIKEYENFTLRVDGRADGIYKLRGIPVIDEIKGVYSDLDEIEEAVPVHLAQAYCYAFMHARKEGIKKLKVQVRYCNMTSGAQKKFLHDCTYEFLSGWFGELLDKYYRWAEYLSEWSTKRGESVKGLEFPFEYRPGQKQLTADVYRTILRRKQLFVRAATGIGKTMSVVFPSVHALGAGEADRIFYLTARTVAGTVANEAFDILRDKGVRIKTLSMTSKEKLCIFDEPVCDPEVCERAKGHFDRVNDAVYELLTGGDGSRREDILAMAEKHRVCPYEMQLDLASFCDAVICDYNYAFDPVASLKRFFAEGSAKEDMIFLVDEAHNLADRGREMFSASLYSADLAKAVSLIKDKKSNVRKYAKKALKILDALNEECGNRAFAKIKIPDSFIISLMNLSGALDEYLKDERDREKRKPFMELYFAVRFFLQIADAADDRYETVAMSTAAGFGVKYYCMDPSTDLQAVLDKGCAAVLFSATLQPIKYYKNLISLREDDYAVYVPSPFSKEKRLIAIASDVSSLYKRRGKAEYEKIAAYIIKMADARRGNYMAFFPSYEMMDAVYDIFWMMRPEGMDSIIQQKETTETQKEEFLAAFEHEGTHLVGFCVLGGLYAEGIDLTGEKLIGAAVVGTGIPGLSGERDLLAEHYSASGKSGFDYAYRYPGMNKVRQAAGRVIRTADDIGVILPLDERFTNRENRELLPREWNDAKVVSLESVDEVLENFWKTGDKAY